MGLNLRKLKDAAFAQINPFDGGKTASTVWNNTPVGYKDQAQTIRPTGLASRNGTIYIDQQARQASQARPQQSFIPGNQQKPSGFMGALNDAFDANTANDIAKRNQAELAKAQMAKENGRVYAPKLNQTYTQQQTALGNRSYTNPIQSIAYGLAKDPAKGINSLAGAYAKGLEGTAGLTAIAASKLVNTSDEFQNNLQQEVGNRMNAPIAFSNKGGLLGQGTNFKTAQELDNKKKFASSMVKTGVDVGSVIPVGGGAAQGTGIIAKQGAKQLIGNSLLNAGLSGTQSIATQVNENRPIDLKEAGLSTLAGGALPVVAFGAGRLLKGASNEVGKKLKMNQTGAIPLDPKNNPLGKGAPIEKTPLEALKAEARKYKSAEEFANSLNAMKYGKVTGVGQLPVSKINKTQIKALTERGLPHTDTNLKVSDFKPGRQVTQPLEVYSKGGSWVVENGNHRLAQALANGDETVPVVFKGGEGKKYSTPIADLYNQAHTQPTPKTEAPQPTVAPKGAPIEKTPTRAQAMNKVAVAASEAPKLKTPNDLLPNGVDETLAKIDAQNKLMFAKSEATGATPKPKVKSAPKPVVKAAQPTKPNVVKSEVTKKKGFNDFVDEIAQSQGIETKYNAPEMFTFNKVLNKVSGGKMQNLMQISPARLASQKVEDKVASVAQKANVSRKGSKTLNTSRTMFAQTGISDADKMANRRFRDSQSLASDLTKGEMKISDDLASKLADPEKSLDNVYRVIADEKILERTHGKGARLKTKDLTPEEQTIANRIIDAQKRTNEINYRIGRITKEQYDAEKATGHYARMFNIESKGGKQLGKKPIDTMPFQERKDPAEFSDSLMELFVKDPFRGALARQEIAMRSLASHEFMGELVKQGRLLDKKPNKGFQQLNGKKYGKYDGMWADNTTRTQIKQNMEFESDWAKKYVGQLLDDYKANAMGKTQRVLKATKTVLNPGTNVQNIMSNILFFNRGSGVGVIRNATGMARAAKDLAKAKSGKLNAELIQAKKLGVFGNDSGKAMVGDIGAESLASMPDKKNVIMKGFGVAEDIYGGTDNAAKLGLWRNLQKKGLSPEDAAKQVQKFTQDYHNVGRIVGAMADAPVLGKPFARFIPELVRLTKNNLAYNPAGTIAGLAAIAYAGNALSEKAGETDEERANREGVIGNTSLPGTRYINKALGGPDRDISLNFAVGDSSVNIARAVGLNFPSEPGQDPNRALLEQLLPFEIPTRKDAQGNEVFDGTKIVTHLGLRPIIETVADRNFMGQSIKDPENKTRVEGSELGKTYTGDIPSSEQKKNVASHLARAYLPMGNEIDSLVAAFKGEPNAMGKERTPMQAALRTVGVKVEKNDQATRDKRAGTKEFFEGKLGQVNDFLNKNPDLKDEYLKIKSGTIDRNTDRKVVDLVGPEKWQKISAEKSGRLFDQMKAEDEYQHQQDSTYPIDPIFSNQLSKEQRNQLLEIRSRSSGVGIEQEEILRATKPWYQNFEAAERDRNTKLSAYFDKLKSEGKLKDTQNERVKEYAALYDKYAPQQTPLMTKYYKMKDSDPEGAKVLFSSNPELSDQFDAYKEQKLKYINAKRKIEGQDPIDRNTFMNVTFGYEDDERKVFNELKYGRGYGGYSKGGYSRRGGGSGGGGSGDGLASEYDNPYKYAVSIKAKGSSKATVKLGGKIAKRGVTAKATSKPKVTIKKSTA